MPDSKRPCPDANPLPRHEGMVQRAVVRWRAGERAADSDWIASEVPVALFYNNVPHVVMMATPFELADFALGFSLSESVIASPAEFEHIEQIDLLEGIELRVRIPAERADAVASRQRNLTGRSSCGLCGTQQLEHVVRHPPAVGASITIDSASIQQALQDIGDAQPINALTGATHAAAWADAAGSLLLVREDVGRHNALDKLLGAMSTACIDTQSGFLLVTSRASYEMVQKAATLGIGVLVAMSAPTALAIHLAESTGVTLVGFARSASHVVYTQRQRIR